MQLVRWHALEKSWGLEAKGYGVAVIAFQPHREGQRCTGKLAPIFALHRSTVFLHGQRSLAWVSHTAIKPWHGNEWDNATTLRSLLTSLKPRVQTFGNLERHQTADHPFTQIVDQGGGSLRPLREPEIWGARRPEIPHCYPSDIRLPNLSPTALAIAVANCCISSMYVYASTFSWLHCLTVPEIVDYGATAEEKHARGSKTVEF